MKTFSYDPRPQIRCDCCGAMATRKGGDAPFFLCAGCARLPHDEIANRTALRYSAKPASKTHWRSHLDGTCQCDNDALVALVCGSGKAKAVGTILE